MVCGGLGRKEFYLRYIANKVFEILKEEGFDAAEAYNVVFIGLKLDEENLYKSIIDTYRTCRKMLGR